MFENLEAVRKQYEELQQRLEQPEVYSDASAYSRYQKELKDIAPVAEAYGEKCYEVPVGFKHISSGMEEHNALIGGESSGGLTVRGHISGKDGLYAASLLVEMLSVTGKTMSGLIRDLYDRFGEMHTAEFDWAGPRRTRRGSRKR